LAKVRAYADAMIEHGRDTVGETTSPLLLISIDPQTMAIPNVGSPRGLVVARLPMSFRHCANPHLDQNLYQIMYALSEITDDVIANLIAAYRLTKCEKYLARAEHCADMAIEVFLSDGPLPKTIGKAADYCAASRCDTLMMQLLDLYLIRNRPEAHVKLIYTDR
jgi:hypothetical protein